MDEAKVVVLEEPLILTTEAETKLVPLTVRIKPDPPTRVDVGEIDVVAGIGLLVVKTCEFEVPPPRAGLNTVTVEVPAEAISATVITAVNWLEETKVVALDEPFH